MFIRYRDRVEKTFTKERIRKWTAQSQETQSVVVMTIQQSHFIPDPKTPYENFSQITLSTQPNISLIFLMTIQRPIDLRSTSSNPPKLEIISGLIWGKKMEGRLVIF